MTKSCVLIPARFDSSRYRGKPLVKILDKPMVIWVAERSALAVGKENVFVATDNQEIAHTVESYGYQYIMTSKHCLTGTDRVSEASQTLNYDIIINVQGDEPIINPEDILKCIKIKELNPNSVVNGYCPVSANDDPSSSNIPKVIFNETSELIYMSRALLPGFKSKNNAPKHYYKQVCIYGFSKEDLNLFTSLGRKSFLESCEDIEILRFLEFDKTVKMFRCEAGSLAVDVPSDVTKVEAFLKEKSK